MMKVVKSVIDSATKLAVIVGIVFGSYWAVSNVKEMRSATTLASQTNAINEVIVKLKDLKNSDVDKILGIKR